MESRPYAALKSFPFRTPRIQGYFHTGQEQDAEHEGAARDAELASPPDPALQVTCEAAGLELAVSGWWSGAPGRPRGRSRKRKEDVWLQNTVAGGLQSGAHHQLLRSGIPEHVVQSGVQLGQALLENPSVHQAWRERDDESTGLLRETSTLSLTSFSSSMRSLQKTSPRRFEAEIVDSIYQCYDVRTLPPVFLSNLEDTSLVLSPRGPSGERLPSAHRSPRAGRPKKLYSARQFVDSFTEGKQRPCHDPEAKETYELPAIREARRDWDLAAEQTLGGLTCKASAATQALKFRVAARLEKHQLAGEPHRFHEEDEAGGSIESGDGGERLLPPPPPVDPPGPPPPPAPEEGPPETGASFGAGSPRGGSRRQGSKGSEPVRQNSDASRSKQTKITTEMRRPAAKRYTKKRTSNFALWEAKKFISVNTSMLSAESSDKAKATTKTQEYRQDADTEGDDSASLLRNKVVSQQTVAAKAVHGLGAIKQIFEAFDTDRSGFIEPPEFPPLLAKLLGIRPQELDKREVWRIWDTVDLDGSGTMDFDEFHRWYCDFVKADMFEDHTEFISSELVTNEQRMLRNVAKSLDRSVLEIEKLWDEFKKLDADNSGTMEIEEFEVLVQKQFAKQGPPVPESVVRKLWLDIDNEGAGSVTFKGFATWYTRFIKDESSAMEQYYAFVSGKSV
eukprot:TRINITY_DN10266_c0_g3_i1.p1 TRINITY_DN10266_c0_g3~~TRINITY_DN10266_c0_g3_i1.p1  ORF type:complete len:676 (+),score=153.71 TRINITY_DN10266_c0_g3_i1:1-2028(+)